MSLYSNGSFYNAFVQEGKELVVHRIKPERIAFKKTFNYSITSVITVGSRVFFSLSDGRILQFPKSANRENQGTVEICKMKGPVSLLGGSEQYLVYLTKGNHIGYIGRPGSNSLSSNHSLGSFPILAYSFDETNEQLLVATENNTLHQIKVNIEKSCLDSQEHSLRSEKNWDLSAVSKNGDVAFHHDGHFHISNPLKNIAAKFIQFGDLDNNSGGPTCFAGENHQYLVYCGTKRIGIGLAKLDNDRWVFCQDISANDLKEYIPDAMGFDEPPLQDIRPHGKDVKIKVQSKEDWYKAATSWLKIELPSP
jgi:hypothetical protein